mgnify:CR=1 FL=1
MKSDSDVMLAAETEIKRWGPRRVLIDKEGTAVSPERAYRLQDRPVDIIFIRKDGWTLGATSELAEYAEQLWADHWIAVLVTPGIRPITYTEYKKLSAKS